MKKIISFSLYSDSQKHLQGAVENLKLAKKIYSEWKVRFYVDDAVPQNVINKLKKDGAEIINISWKIPGAYWRFLPIEDKSVDIFIVRDVDSRLSEREKLAVDEWLKSKKAMHIMRDHPNHKDLVIAGMWGFKNKFKKDFNFLEMMKDFCKEHDYKFSQGDDNLLLKRLYQMYSDNLLVHDEFFYYESDKKKFPRERKGNEYVGDNFVKENYNILEKALSNNYLLQKKENNRSIQIKLLKNEVQSKFPTLNNKNIKNFLAKQSKDSKGNWNKLKFSNHNPDYFIIINNPSDFSNFWRNVYSHDPKKSIIFQFEPHDTINTWKRNIYQKDPRYLKRCLYTNCPHIGIFFLNKTYSELKKMKIKKYKVLSSITKCRLKRKGDKKRIAFLKFLEKKDLSFLKTPYDFYSYDNPLNFKNYRGKLLPLKDDGLFPYKYTIALENSIEKNYITEKLYDGILAECLCFYWGAPNVEEWIDSRAIIKLDLDDFEKAYETIRQAIKNNEWEKRIGYIRKEKQKILDKYNFFPKVESLIKEIESSPKSKVSTYAILKYYIRYRILGLTSYYLNHRKCLILFYLFSKFLKKKSKSYEKLVDFVKAKNIR